MPVTGTGLDNQIGYKKEVEYGTPVTVDTFLPFVSESMKAERTRINSNLIRAGHRIMGVSEWAPGTRRVTGSIATELQSGNLTDLLEAMFGGRATAANVHTFTPDDLPSLTVQVGRTAVNGTTYPWTYSGCMVRSWTLDCAVDEFVGISLDLVGHDESVGTALATATYAAAPAQFVFTGGSVDVDGLGTCVTNITLTGDNGLQDSRFCIGSYVSKQQKETSLRVYSGSLTAEFEDMTLYNIYAAGTAIPLTLGFVSVDGGHELEIAMTVRLDGDTPTSNGREITPQTVNFTAIAPTTDASAITATYTAPPA